MLSDATAKSLMCRFPVTRQGHIVQLNGLKIQGKGPEEMLVPLLASKH